MRYTNEHIEQLKQIDLTALVGAYGAEMRRDGASSHRGQCPVCRTSTLIINRNRFWCNTCRGDRGGSTIDFVMLAENADYKTALNILSGKSLQPMPAQTYEQEKRTFSTDYWLDKLGEWQPALTPTHTVGQYLLSRGLKPETWKAFGLGACKCKVNDTSYRAVAIPWYVDGALVAGRYRLAVPKNELPIDKDGKPIRFMWWKGSATGNLYGEQTGINHDTVIITEGELNCLSIWQECGAWVDVRSTGSENFTITQAIADKIAKTWAHVIVWADKGSVADKWAAVIEGAISIETSKIDANERLQAGVLRGHVTGLLQDLGLREEAPPIGDLTGYIGQDIDAPTWAALQAECTRRYNGLWTMHANQTGDHYHVTGLHAKPPDFRGENL